MRTRPNVSVCLATFNGARYLPDQLLSIQAELSEGDEVVAVDDASSDNSVELVAEAFEQEPGISAVVVRNEENRGHVASFLRAISLATNDIVMLSDQDDVWPSGRVEYLVDTLLAEGVSAVFGSLQTFGRGEHSLIQNRPFTAHGPLAAMQIATDFRRRRVKYGSASAFRVDDLDPHVSLCADSHEIWIALQACLARGIHFSGRVVTYRRVHETNLTQKRTPIRALAARGKNLKQLAATAWHRRVRR